RRTALAVVLLLAVASPLWIYTRDVFAEPLAGLGLMLFVLACEGWRQEGSPRQALLAGLGLGVSLLAKAAHVVLLPVAALAALWAARRSQHPRRGAAFAALAGLAAPLALAALYNWARFGSALESGYGEEIRQWTTPALEGLAGLL